MMHIRKFLILASYIGTNVYGSPLAANYVEHEHQTLHISHLWEIQSKAHKDMIVPIRIGLTQSNLDKGHNLLMEVYVLDCSCTFTDACTDYVRSVLIMTHPDMENTTLQKRSPISLLLRSLRLMLSSPG
jgi:hypothetical protein